MYESWLLAYWQQILVYKLILSFQSLTFWSKLPLNHRGCVLTCSTWGVHEKEHDFFSFHGTWLLFVFGLVASLLCLPPHCTLAMKKSRIVKGLIAPAIFCFFAHCINTDWTPPPFTVTASVAEASEAIGIFVGTVSIVRWNHYIKTCFQSYLLAFILKNHSLSLCLTSLLSVRFLQESD